MLFNHLSRFLILVLIVEYGQTKSCNPTRIILLSNCSFQLTTKSDNRSLTMIVPYALNRTEKNSHDFLSLFLRSKPYKPLIRLNLNFLQCSTNKQIFQWTSLESSSTLRGEFLRTTHIEHNLMYLPAGRIFLKNLTTIDCSSRTLYRTDDQQIFEFDFKIESTLNDFCLNDYSCYPNHIYRCDQTKQRCTCRQTFQSFLIHEQYPICVQTSDQCSNKSIRCIEWCQLNSSSPMCLCPNEYSKKISEFNQTYCESQTGGKCNAYLRCPSSDQCLDGRCQNRQHKSHSFDTITLSIIISSFVLLFISILLTLVLCIFHRQRWKKDYHSPLDTTDKKDVIVPNSSNYDNVTYDVFKQNMHLSSANNNNNNNNNDGGDDDDDDDDGNNNDNDDQQQQQQCIYEPKIVYLGGEQQLTAIFA